MNKKFVIKLLVIFLGLNNFLATINASQATTLDDTSQKIAEAVFDLVLGLTKDSPNVSNFVDSIIKGSGVKESLDLLKKDNTNFLPSEEQTILDAAVNNKKELLQDLGDNEVLNDSQKEALKKLGGTIQEASSDTSSSGGGGDSTTDQVKTALEGIFGSIGGVGAIISFIAYIAYKRGYLTADNYKDIKNESNILKKVSLGAKYGVTFYKNSKDAERIKDAFDLMEKGDFDNAFKLLAKIPEIGTFVEERLKVDNLGKKIKILGEAYQSFTGTKATEEKPEVAPNIGEAFKKLEELNALNLKPEQKKAVDNLKTKMIDTRKAEIQQNIRDGKFEDAKKAIDEFDHPKLKSEKTNLLQDYYKSKIQNSMKEKDFVNAEKDLIEASKSHSLDQRTINALWKDYYQKKIDLLIEQGNIEAAKNLVKEAKPEYINETQKKLFNQQIDEADLKLKKTRDLKVETYINDLLTSGDSGTASTELEKQKPFISDAKYNELQSKLNQKLIAQKIQRAQDLLNKIKEKYKKIQDQYDKWNSLNADKGKKVKELADKIKKLDPKKMSQQSADEIDQALRDLNLNDPSGWRKLTNDPTSALRPTLAQDISDLQTDIDTLQSNIKDIDKQKQNLGVVDQQKQIGRDLKSLRDGVQQTSTKLHEVSNPNLAKGLQDNLKVIRDYKTKSSPGFFEGKTLEEGQEEERLRGEKRLQMLEEASKPNPQQRQSDIKSFLDEHSKVLSIGEIGNPLAQPLQQYDPTTRENISKFQQDLTQLQQKYPGIDIHSELPTRLQQLSSALKVEPISSYPTTIKPVERPVSPIIEQHYVM